MKRLSLVVLVILVLFGAFAPSAHVFDHVSVTASAEARQNPSTLTVYITKTGEKYHKDACRYLRQSRIEITLREAVKRGYEPCSVCKPPTL